MYICFYTLNNMSKKFFFKKDAFENAESYPVFPTHNGYDFVQREGNFYNIFFIFRSN